MEWVYGVIGVLIGYAIATVVANRSRVTTHVTTQTCIATTATPINTGMDLEVEFEHTGEKLVDVEVETYSGTPAPTSGTPTGMTTSPITIFAYDNSHDQVMVRGIFETTAPVAPSSCPII